MRAAGPCNVPFPEKLQLNSELDGIDDPILRKHMRLPGQPCVRIDDHAGVWRYLECDLSLPDLEKLAPHLWLMSMQSSANISALHRQKVKNRRIVITEDPQLHLVWVKGQVFIKPLPPYLLSHVFWTSYLQAHGCDTPKCDLSDNKHTNQRRHVLAAALGFLRTYHYLIQHESDFHIAQDERLIPSNITWEAFSYLMFDVASTVQDGDVSGRYAYGELRLSRLNFYTKIFLRRFYFRRQHSQYGTYFAQFFAPLLFLFGTFSVVLSAMQVITATDALFSSHTAWYGFWQLCRWFSISSVGLTLLVCLALALLFLYRFVGEWYHAIGKRCEQSKVEKNNIATSIV